MKKFGLPTYPIYEGMDIGEGRDLEELEWLLKHGYFKNPSLTTYYSIYIIDGYYALQDAIRESRTNYRHGDILEIKESIPLLIKSKAYREYIGKYPLTRWQWFEKKEDDK